MPQAVTATSPQIIGLIGGMHSAAACLRRRQSRERSVCSMPMADPSALELQTAPGIEIEATLSQFETPCFHLHGADKGFALPAYFARLEIYQRHSPDGAGISRHIQVARLRRENGQFDNADIKGARTAHQRTLPRSGPRDIIRSA